MRATPLVLALLNPTPTRNPYTESEIRKKLAGCGIKKTWGNKEVEGGGEIRHDSIQLYNYVVQKRISKEETFFRILGRWPYQDENNKVRDSAFVRTLAIHN